MISENPLIIDTGTVETKIGVGGEDKMPRIVIPACLVKDNTGSGIEITGTSAYELRTKEDLIFPNLTGKPQNWDDLTLLWRNIFSHELKMSSSKKPVLLAEKPISSKVSKAKTTKFFFESLQVPKLSITNEATLSTYSFGSTKGLVLDIGGGITTITSVHNGFSLPHLSETLEYAGVNISEFLQKKLKAKSIDLNLKTQSEILTKIKQNYCYTALFFEEEMKGYEKGEKNQDYTLPDGTKVNLGSEMIECPETFFNPELAGKGFDGIHKTMNEVVLKADPALRSLLYGNIILAGGGAGFKGFGTRLEKELAHMVAPTQSVSFLNMESKKNAVWIGASVLSTLKSFERMMISEEEYEENGESIVYRKCY